MKHFPVTIKVTAKERRLLLSSADAGRTYCINFCKTLAEKSSEEFSNTTWLQWQEEFNRSVNKLRRDDQIFIVMNSMEGMMLAVLFYPYLTYRRQRILVDVKNKLKQFVPDDVV